MRVHIALLVLVSLAVARETSYLTSYLDTVDWFWQSYKTALTQSHTAQFLRDAQNAYKVFVLNEDPFAESERRE